MLDNVKKVREPLGWALLAIVVAMLAVGVTQVAQFFLGEYAASPDANWSLSIGFLALSLLPYEVVLALVGVCFWCLVDPATPHALLLGRVSVWVLTIVQVAALAGFLYGLRALTTFGGSVPLDVVSSSLGMLIGVAAIVALWFVMWRAEDEVGDELQSSEDAEPDQEEDSQPAVWKRPEAAGTVWRTAAEAAAGAPGSRYLAEPGDQPEEGSDRAAGDRPTP